MSEHIHIERILILDDDADFRKLLLAYLGKLFDGVDLEEYDPVARGVPGENFDWSRYDVLILDYYLCIHNVTGLDILATNRRNEMFPATIMLTGAGNEEVAVRAIKAGVYDYLRKETLDKEQLRRSILDAFEKHKTEKKRLSELTHQSRAFNKALFYQQLEETPLDRDSARRVLLVIQLDDHELLEQSVGVILRDNIVRHVARQSFEVFDIGGCNPHITRLSDVAVALLIDAPESLKTLEFNLNGLCNHLHKRPYRFDERKMRFTVSMGVVPVPASGRSAEALIKQAREACAEAATQAGNSFYIYSPPASKTIETPVEAEAAVAVTPEAPPEVEAPPKAEAPEAPLEIEVPPEAESPPEAEAPDAPPEVETPPEAEPPPEAEAPPEVDAPPEAEAPEAPLEIEASPEAEPPPEVEAPPQVEAPPEAKAPPAAAPAREREVDLDDAGLNEAALRIKRAFDEKRIVQAFQPIMPLFNTDDEKEDAGEIYLVRLQMIDINGQIAGESDVFAGADTPSFRQYIDRWMLRESIGRIINNPAQEHTFLIRLSGASLADPNMFNWLRTLLSGLDERKPGHSIILEISADDFAALRRKVTALITYLGKTHGFRFVLGGISDIGQVASICGAAKLDLVRLNLELFNALQDTSEADKRLPYDILKSAGTRTIVDKVEDAGALTSIISSGADYAMGNFIGEPMNQIDDSTNVESLEIS